MENAHEMEEWSTIATAFSHSLSILKEVPDDIVTYLQPIIKFVPISAIPILAKSIPSSSLLELSQHYQQQQLILYSLPLAPQPSTTTLTSAIALITQNSNSSLTPSQWVEFTERVGMALRALQPSNKEIVKMVEQAVRTVGYGELTEGCIRQFTIWMMAVMICLEEKQDINHADDCNKQIYHEALGCGGFVGVLPLVKEVVRMMIEVGLRGWNEV